MSMRAIRMRLAWAAALVALPLSRASAAEMDQAGFMPHGTCFLWHPGILSLHVASDALIARAYFSIPVFLIRFVRRRRDVPFGFVLWMFAAFIVACGLTHIMDIWTVWHPDYWLAGGIKALTAVASVATAVTLVPLLPLALSLKTPQELERLKDRLELEHRRIIETTTEGRWLLDTSGRTTFVNARLAEMLGYLPDELLGRSLYDFMEPGGVAATRLVFERCAAGHAENLEVLFMRKDGSDLWGTIGMNPIEDESGSCTGIVGMLVDNTERRIAYMELALTERRYRVLGEVMPHIVWVADPSGEVIHWNNAWYAYIGSTPERMLETRWAEFVHPDDLASTLERWQRSLETGDSFEAQFRLLRAADRTYRWHLGTALPERNARGDIVEWVGSCTDMHDYRVASTSREILDTIPQMVSMHGEDGLVDYLNPRWNHFTGCPPGGGMGRAWQGFVHPDDLAQLATVPPFKAHTPGRGAKKFELRIRRGDGVYRWFLMESQSLPPHTGNSRRWLQTSTDIDDVKSAQVALKESEAQFRMLTEAMPEMVWSVDAHDAIEYVNHRWSEYTGLSLEESVTAGRHTVLEIGGLLNVDAGRRANPPTEFECEVRMRRYDGVYRWHLVRTVPLLDADGTAIRWVTTGSDIENQKSALLAIEVAHDAAVASTESKSRFLAAMSQKIERR